MEAITEDLLQARPCFYHGVPGGLPWRARKPMTVAEGSDVWKAWPNVYLMRLTVTLFNSLLSKE